MYSKDHTTRVISSDSWGFRQGKRRSAGCMTMELTLLFLQSPHTSV